MATIINITDLTLPDLLPYTGLTEAQLRNRQHKEQGLFIAESEKVILSALQAGYIPVSMLMEDRKLKTTEALLAAVGDIPVYTGARDLLSRLTGYALTRGVLCLMRRKPLPDPDMLLKNAKRIAVLENITDASNVGAILRSAAALKLDAVLLSPSCCDPLCRKSIRVSMGTAFRIPWTYLSDSASDWPGTGMQLLKKHGFLTAALALDARAVSIRDERLKQAEKTALILGTEGDGLSAETLSLSDMTVIIPMREGVDSLNVAAAAAVAFWEIGAE